MKLTQAWEYLLIVGGFGGGYRGGARWKGASRCPVARPPIAFRLTSTLLSLLPLLWLWSSSAIGADANASFEVASIAHHNFREFSQPIHVDATEFRAVGISLKNLTAYGYQLKFYQVIMPEWAQLPGYDVWAKLPPASGKADVRGMVRNLLQDRFKIKTHWEERSVTALALAVRPSGPKLRQVPDDTKSRVSVSSAGYLAAYAVSISQLCDILSDRLHIPVTDETGLAGRYDFVMRNVPLANVDVISSSSADSTEALNGGMAGESIYTTLRDVGLVLRRMKAPIRYLVVDSVTKEFTAN